LAVWTEPAAGPDLATFAFRRPCVEDGPALWNLARESGGLDVNSPYAYLLLGHLFTDTCVLAEDATGPAGFTSALLAPGRPETLFVWQVAVHPARRRRGLAGRMLRHLLGRPACAGVRAVEATVTPGNRASRALFVRLAAEMGASCRILPGFPRAVFPSGGHEPEMLVRVGPWTARPAVRGA
jgi:L-2,4-diaminobutyric acid acetyltransferase